MDSEKRRFCTWFEEKVDQKFEISDQEDNYLGQWTLKEVRRTTPVQLVDGVEQDSYWLRFDSTVQWYDGLYQLKAEDGGLVILFANAYTATDMQVTVN